MARIELTGRVGAPRARVFDLARSVDAHVASAASTQERAVAVGGSRTHGLLSLGDEVTWRARHLGVIQQVTSRIVAYDRPRHFRDSMVRGAFARFDHDHFFDDDGRGGTVVRDVFDFTAPLGFLGRVAERAVLARTLRRFLERRAAVLKDLAEGEDWRAFVPDTPSA